MIVSGFAQAYPAKGMVTVGADNSVVDNAWVSPDKLLATLALHRFLKPRAGIIYGNLIVGDYNGSLNQHGQFGVCVTIFHLAIGIPVHLALVHLRNAAGILALGYQLRVVFA